MAVLINFVFMCLAVFHLAYLGQMFLSDPDLEEFDYQVGGMGRAGWREVRWKEKGRLE